MVSLIVVSRRQVWLTEHRMLVIPMARHAVKGMWKISLVLRMRQRYSRGIAVRLRIRMRLRTSVHVSWARIGGTRHLLPLACEDRGLTSRVEVAEERSTPMLNRGARDEVYWNGRVDGRMRMRWNTGSLKRRELLSRHVIQNLPVVTRKWCSSHGKITNDRCHRVRGRTALLLHLSEHFGGPGR